MEGSAIRMLLLVDEGVPDSVTDFFRERGHDVRLVRELFLPGTPDPVIAAMGNELGATLVTWNLKGLNRRAGRAQAGEAPRFAKLGRIVFRCSAARASKRAEELIESIEFEHTQAQQRGDRPLAIEIAETSFSVMR